MNEEKFFSVNGRLRRKDYLIRSFLLAIPAALINLLLQSSMDSGTIVFGLIISIVITVLMMIQAVKRLHDINMSGWYWLIFLIPIVNVVFGLYVLFKDGTPGYNEYGEDPKGR